MTEATICTIGDEILIGQIVDTNSAYISNELNLLGVKVKSEISIGDNYQDISFYLKRAIEESDIVIVTGGLGPTKDDITKRALAELTGCNSYSYNSTQLGIIKEICARRAIELSQLNRDQALVPDNCTVLPNYNGTAPGMVFRIPKGEKKTLLFSLPGVPFEMKGLIPSVFKVIKDESIVTDITHRTLVTYGMPESALAKFLEEWEDSLPEELKLAYLPNPLTGIRLRLSIYGKPAEHAGKVIDKAANELKELLGDMVYGTEKDTLDSVVSEYLRSKNKTLSVAESCTGGLLSSLIISHPGASEIYNGGVTTYSNLSKVSVLGVNEETIRKYGAVSKECATEMAEGARRLFGSDYAIATTGIAGPTGGSEEKPVGTVWIAIAGDGFSDSKKSVLSGDRTRNINRFAAEALNFLRLILLDESKTKITI